MALGFQSVAVSGRLLSPRARDGIYLHCQVQVECIAARKILDRSEIRSIYGLKGLRSPAARAVAAVLAEAREKAGLTQRQLAAQIRRPHSVIGMIETGQRQVTVPELITLAKVLGADPIDLLRAVLRQSSL